MTKRSALAALIHAEHRQTLALLDALEERVAGRAPPLDPGRDGPLLERLAAGIDADILRHFAVEETVVFPLIFETAGTDLVLMLIGEHEGIGQLASALLAAVRTASTRPLTADEWASFRADAAAFIDQETFHLQKEETAVVQRLPALLDDREDAAAADCFIALAGLPAGC